MIIKKQGVVAQWGHCQTNLMKLKQQVRKKSIIVQKTESEKEVESM